MSAVIAEMLLRHMDEMNTQVIYYRCQRYSRLYLRRVLWRANCNEDNRRAMQYAGRTVAL